MKNIGFLTAKVLFPTAVLCTFLLSDGVAFADNVRTQAELALLPRHCYGAEQVREISRDPRSKNDYAQIYGFEYIYFHHYCWALNSENIATMIADKFLRESKLQYAIGDLDFSINRSRDTFVFMPDMLTAKARILGKLGRNGEAIAILYKLIRIKSNYAPAYRDISSFYEKLGAKDKALGTLEDGLKIIPDSRLLLKEYRRISGVEFIAPAEPPPPATSATTPLPDLSNLPPEGEPTTAHPMPNTKPLQPSDPGSTNMDQGAVEDPNTTKNSANPYCRFCP